MAGVGETATLMKHESSALMSVKITAEPSTASSLNGESVNYGKSECVDLWCNGQMIGFGEGV